MNLTRSVNSGEKKSEEFRGVGRVSFQFRVSVRVLGVNWEKGGGGSGVEEDGLARTSSGGEGGDSQDNKEERLQS